MTIDLNDARPQPPDADIPGAALHDIAALKGRLAEQADIWVPTYFPRGRKSPDGKEWRVANTNGDAAQRMLKARCKARCRAGRFSYAASSLDPSSRLACTASCSRSSANVRSS